LSVLCKSVAALLPVFIIGCALILPGWGSRRKQVIQGLTICLVAVAAGVFPWILRNKNVSGSWVYPSTSGGLALYTAYVYASNPEQDIRDSANQAAFTVVKLAQSHGIRLDLEKDRYPRQFYDSGEEVRADRLAQAEAKKWLESNRLAMFKHVLGNTWRFWIGAPTPRAMLVSAIMNLPILGAAILGLFVVRWWRNPGLYVWLCASLYLIAGHVAVLAVVRYSLTVMPLLGLLAGVAVVRLLWKDKLDVATESADAGVNES
jgi:hypothetical protein